MFFHPIIKKINQFIEQEKIGKILAFTYHSGMYLPDWHPYEDYRKGYAAKKSLGGGIALTMIHELDFLYWFFGDIKKIIEESKLDNAFKSLFSIFLFSGKKP